MNKIRRFISKQSLTFSLVFYVFFIMFVSFVAQALISGNASDIFFLVKIDSFEKVRVNLVLPIGVFLSIILSKRMLRPIRDIIMALQKVSNGEFNTRIQEKGFGEIGELETSFNKMAEELSAINNLRSDFVNNFSHQFKTPIMSIKGFARLLQEDGLNEKDKQEYLEIIVNELDRLTQLSTNILNLSKYENITILPSDSVFRMDEQIRHVILLLEQKWMEKHLNLDIDLDEIIFTGNEDLTYEIWMNLFDNAIKYSPLEGNILISLKNRERGIQFMIRDEGLGMTQETKNHAFDTFYRGQNVQEISGDGLGLSIVSQIIYLLEGEIEVESELNKGSIFKVILPQ